LFGPFSNDERAAILNELGEVLGLKLAREAILPLDEPILERWSLLRSPVCQFWKECTAMMSPVSKSWVLASGLRNCANSYFAKIMNKRQFAFCSAQASEFDQVFLNAMGRNLAVIILDFDFTRPNELVVVVHDAQSNRAPFNYKGESYQVPKDFMVYFDVPNLPEDDSVHFDVRFIDLHIEGALISELIASRLFELTTSGRAHEVVQFEHDLRALRNEASACDLSLMNLLHDSGTHIFEAKNIQWDIMNLITRQASMKKRDSQLRMQQLYLFDDFPTMTTLATTLCQFFEPFPNNYRLWQIFEAQYENVPRIPSESLYESVKKRLLCMIAAELPIRTRIGAFAAAFEFNLDGSNCAPVQRRGVPLMRSTSCDILVLMGQKEEVGLPHSRSTDVLVPEPPDEEEGFDKLVKNLAIASQDQLFAFQSMKNVLSISSSQRPLICHVEHFAYQMVALVHIVALRDNYALVQPAALLEGIHHAAQTGTILVTICSSTQDLLDLLAPIAAVFASGFLSPNFRLIIIVHNMSFQTAVSYSRLFDRCELVSIDAPINVKVAMASSISSVNSIAFDRFVARLGFFDAAFGILNRMYVFAPLPSFYNFHVARQCAVDISKANVGEIQRFVTNVIYESQDVNFWNRIDLASKSEYVLPKSFQEKSIETSLSNFPDLDDPTLFGFSPRSLRLFKTRLMTVEEEAESTLQVDLNQVETVPTLRTELFLIKLSLSLGRHITYVDHRLTQILTMPEVLDMSLLVAPDVFIETIKYFTMMNSRKQFRRPVVALDGVNYNLKRSSEEPGSMVTGLMCQGAQVQGGAFSVFDGCKGLPQMWLHAVEHSNVFTRANFYFEGRIVAWLYVRAPPDLVVNVMPCHLSN
jgi:hypothetical protein